MKKLLALFSLALILTIVIIGASIYDEMSKAANATAARCSRWRQM